MRSHSSFANGHSHGGAAGTPGFTSMPPLACGPRMRLPRNSKIGFGVGFRPVGTIDSRKTKVAVSATRTHGRRPGFSSQPAARLPSPPALPQRLRRVATNAERLSCLNVIPAASILADVGAMNDRAHVVRLGLALVAADPAALPALPGVPRQHSQPPCLVSFVAVASRCRVGPSRVVTLSGCRA